MKNFRAMMNELFKTFGSSRLISLATCNGEHVNARTVSSIIANQKFYFQTSNQMNKAREIAANEQVAICFDNAQIQGKCREIGHPLNKENEWFIKLYKEAFPNAFKKYSHLKSERIYEITPRMIALWKYSDGEAYKDQYDVVTGKYIKIHYSAE